MLIAFQLVVAIVVLGGLAALLFASHRIEDPSDPDCLVCPDQLRTAFTASSGGQAAGLV
ncbi:MAG: hypothetical protein M3140_09535 [Actinomycetota bacterium]|nr:hypothetical protein [Actinomycetota bacterium]